MARPIPGTTISRRAFLGGIAGGAAAVLLAACGGTTPTNTPASGGTTSAAPSSAGQTNPFGSATASARPASTAPSAAASTAASTAASAAPSPAAGGTPAASAAAATSPAASGAITSTGKMTYWGGLIFSDEANKLLSDTIKAWGTKNKIEIDVVMINQNETNQKVSAAVESNTMPDALDMGLGLMLLLSNTKKLTPLDDLWTKVGNAQGGWIKGVDDATDPKKFGGTRNGIPFGSSGNLLNIRKDALDKAGLPIPKTWEELGEAAVKITKPPFYGMGFSVSNVGDGNLQVAVLQSWGGRIASDDGKKVTLKSPETKAYLEWITGIYKRGAFPPGATTWDGAGDNNAYQSGQAGFIANPGSVYLWMRDNDKELLAGSAFSSLPKGPKLQISEFGPNVRAIPVGGKNIEAAKALIEALANDTAFMDKYYSAAIYGPVLKNYIGFNAFKADPVHAGLSDLAQNGTAPGFPDVNNTAYADFNNNFLIPKMIQRVVVDNYDLDRAIDETQKAGEAIYAKY
jgi:multiple sugar transport system substrate-binding protein